jgi:DNA-binding NarL/FixJ family response regulator
MADRTRFGIAIRQLAADRAVTFRRPGPAWEARVLMYLARSKAPGSGTERWLSRPRSWSRVSKEQRILAQVADGRTDGQIAAELGLAEKTVKNYVSSILAKLEVARRAEAAAYLARHTTHPGG